MRVARNADEPARQPPLERVTRREERRVRAAVAQRHAEALRRTDDNVGTPFAGRLEQAERQQVCRDDRQRARLVRRGDHTRIVTDRTVGGRILQQHAEHIVVELHRRRRGDDNAQAQGSSAGAHDGNGLRMAVGGDHKGGAVAARGVARHRHRFGGGGRFIEQRGVGDFHRRQVANHGLEIEQRFQPPLRDFRLVRGIRSIPAGVLEQVAPQRRRRDGTVVAHPEVAARHHVAPRELAQSRQCCRFRERRRQFERPRQAKVGWYDRVDQLVQRLTAELGEHLGDVGWSRPDVPAHEGVGMLEPRHSGPP